MSPSVELQLLPVHGWGSLPTLSRATGVTPTLNGPGARTCGGPLEPRFSLIHYTPLHTITYTNLECPYLCGCQLSCDCHPFLCVF